MSALMNASASAAAADRALLVATEVSRRFGGLKAVDGVSLALERGSLHAVIGTNGAGKSTLINLLSGEIPPSEGRVTLMGQDATRWSQPRRARAGLGRSYQRNTIFMGFTVRENCRLAAQARWQRAWDWWTPAQRCGHSQAAAEEALRKAGLSAQAERVAGAGSCRPRTRCACSANRSRARRRWQNCCAGRR